MPDFFPNSFAHPAQCAGEQTSSQLIATGPCVLASVIVHTDGTNNVTVIVYDNTAASGKIVRRFAVKGTENYGGNALRFPVRMANGIYVAMSGTGGSYIVDFIQ